MSACACAREFLSRRVNDMSDDAPKKKAVRVALTKTQAAQGLGRELIELSRGWLADGKFDPRELKELKTWLSNVPDESLPAIRFLKEEVQRYIENGEIYDWELARLHAALIRVIPPKDREQANAARNEISRVECEQGAPEREAARHRSAEQSREIRERHSERWAKKPATEAQLEFIRNLGGQLPLGASMLEASEMIDRLLGNEVTPAGASSGCASVLVVALFLGGAIAYWSA